MQDIVEGVNGSKTGELEALFRSFQSLKGIVITNILKCKEDLKKLKTEKDKEISQKN